MDTLVLLFSVLSMALAGGDSGNFLRGASPLGMRSDDVPATGLNPTDLGPLQDLIGVWEGSDGFNVVSLPNVTLEPLYAQAFSVQNAGQYYTERLTFSQAPSITYGSVTYGVLNYYQVVHRTKTGNGLLHVETGQWLVNAGSHEVMRLGLIPHGVAVSAKGAFDTQRTPHDIKKHISELTTARHNTNFSKDVTSETDTTPAEGDWQEYFVPQKFTDTGTPQQQSQPGGDTYCGMEGANVFTPVEQRELCLRPSQIVIDKMGSIENKVTQVSAQVECPPAFWHVCESGILQTSNVAAQARVTSFNFTMWLETLPGLRSPTQLQYTQHMYLTFQNNVFCPNGICTYPYSDGMGDRVKWPHVSANTLRKVSPKIAAEPSNLRIAPASIEPVGRSSNQFVKADATDFGPLSNLVDSTWTASELAPDVKETLVFAKIPEIVFNRGTVNATQVKGKRKTCDQEIAGLSYDHSIIKAGDLVYSERGQLLFNKKGCIPEAELFHLSTTGSVSMLASGSSSEGDWEKLKDGLDNMPDISWEDTDELATVASRLGLDNSMSSTTQLLFKPESVAGGELPQLLPGGQQAARMLWIHTLVDKKTRTQKHAIQYTQSANLPSPPFKVTDRALVKQENSYV